MMDVGGVVSQRIIWLTNDRGIGKGFIHTCGLPKHLRSTPGNKISTSDFGTLISCVNDRFSLHYFCCSPPQAGGFGDVSFWRTVSGQELALKVAKVG